MLSKLSWALLESWVDISSSLPSNPRTIGYLRLDPYTAIFKEIKFSRRGSRGGHKGRTPPPICAYVQNYCLVETVFCNDNGYNYLTLMTKTRFFWNRNWECSPTGNGRSTRIAKNVKVSDCRDALMIIVLWPKITFCAEISYRDIDLYFIFRKELCYLWLSIILKCRLKLLPKC